MRKTLILVAALAPLGGCADPCGDTVIARSAAPGGRHGAMLFQRDCGATGGASTQVAVHPVGARPSGPGNAFRADGGHGAASPGPWGGPWAEMRWLAADHLLVRFDAKSRVFAQADAVAGIRVSYEAVPR